MLSKLFGSGSKARDPRISAKKSSKKTNPLSILDSSSDKGKDGKLAKDIVLNDAERQLYQHKMPDIENDLGNMIAEHQEGTVFPNIVILDEPPESLEARYRRLTQLQPRVNKRRMTVPDHITLRFRKEVEEFPINDIVQFEGSQKKPSKMGYISIKRAALIFSPLSSFIDNHSDIVVSIVDTRKRSGQVARTLRLQDNKHYRGEFVLDYSFPRESAHKVSLSFAQEVPTFDTGEQWGVCQLFLDLEESDFPLTSAFQETIGQGAVTTSILQNYKFHPGHLDVAMRDSHIPLLRGMYQQGDIVDDTEPQTDRKQKSAYVKSGGEVLKQARNSKGQVKVSGNGSIDWGEVKRGKQAIVPAYQASIEPEDNSEMAETTQEKIARMNAMMNSQQQNVGTNQPRTHKKHARFDSISTQEAILSRPESDPADAGNKVHDAEATVVGSASSDSGTPIRLGPLNRVDMED